MGRLAQVCCSGWHSLSSAAIVYQPCIASYVYVCVSVCVCVHACVCVHSVHSMCNVFIVGTLPIVCCVTPPCVLYSRKSAS